MMETTKPKTVDLEFEGRGYRLVCNMNVIGAVQEAYNGNLVRALNQRNGIRSTLQFLAAMLTEAARKQNITGENGLPLHFSGEQLGETFTWAQTMEIGAKIWPLIDNAFGLDKKAKKPTEEAEKN